ncbi:MAG: hypothetical protein LBU04_04505, partial [Christensenellaceae bacterium]|nr:hypothetical protein [Christensenellaceae bacterium]
CDADEFVKAAQAVLIANQKNIIANEQEVTISKNENNLIFPEFRKREAAIKKQENIEKQHRQLKFEVNKAFSSLKYAEKTIQQQERLRELQGLTNYQNLLEHYLELAKTEREEELAFVEFQVNTNDTQKENKLVRKQKFYEELNMKTQEIAMHVRAAEENIVKAFDAEISDTRKQRDAFLSELEKLKKQAQKVPGLFNNNEQFLYFGGLFKTEHLQTRTRTTSKLSENLQYQRFEFSTDDAENPTRQLEKTNPEFVDEDSFTNLFEIPQSQLPKRQLEDDTSRLHSRKQRSHWKEHPTSTKRLKGKNNSKKPNSSSSYKSNSSFEEQNINQNQMLEQLDRTRAQVAMDVYVLNRLAELSSAFKENRAIPVPQKLSVPTKFSYITTTMMDKSIRESVLVMASSVKDTDFSNALYTFLSKFGTSTTEVDKFVKDTVNLNKVLIRNFVFDIVQETQAKKAKQVEAVEPKYPLQTKKINQQQLNKKTAVPTPPSQPSYFAQKVIQPIQRLIQDASKIASQMKENPNFSQSYTDHSGKSAMAFHYPEKFVPKLYTQLPPQITTADTNVFNSSLMAQGLKSAASLYEIMLNQKVTFGEKYERSNASVARIQRQLSNTISSDTLNASATMIDSTMNKIATNFLPRDAKLNDILMAPTFKKMRDYIYMTKTYYTYPIFDEFGFLFNEKSYKEVYGDNVEVKFSGEDSKEIFKLMVDDKSSNKVILTIYTQPFLGSFLIKDTRDDQIRFDMELWRSTSLIFTKYLPDYLNVYVTRYIVPQSTVKSQSLMTQLFVGQNPEIENLVQLIVAYCGNHDVGRELIEGLFALCTLNVKGFALETVNTAGAEVAKFGSTAGGSIDNVSHHTWLVSIARAVAGADPGAQFPFIVNNPQKLIIPKRQPPISKPKEVSVNDQIKVAENIAILKAYVKKQATNLVREISVFAQSERFLIDLGDSSKSKISVQVDATDRKVLEELYNIDVLNRAIIKHVVTELTPILHRKKNTSIFDALASKAAKNGKERKNANILNNIFPDANEAFVIENIFKASTNLNPSPQTVSDTIKEACKAIEQDSFSSIQNTVNKHNDDASNYEKAIAAVDSTEALLINNPAPIALSLNTFTASTLTDAGNIIAAAMADIDSILSSSENSFNQNTRTILGEVKTRLNAENNAGGDLLNFPNGEGDFDLKQFLSHHFFSVTEETVKIPSNILKMDKDGVLNFIRNNVPRKYGNLRLLLSDMSLGNTSDPALGASAATNFNMVMNTPAESSATMYRYAVRVSNSARKVYLSMYAKLLLPLLFTFDSDGKANFNEQGAKVAEMVLSYCHDTSSISLNNGDFKEDRILHFLAGLKQPADTAVALLVLVNSTYALKYPDGKLNIFSKENKGKLFEDLMILCVLRSAEFARQIVEKAAVDGSVFAGYRDLVAVANAKNKLNIKMLQQREQVIKNVNNYISKKMPLVLAAIKNTIVQMKPDPDDRNKSFIEPIKDAIRSELSDFPNSGNFSSVFTVQSVEAIILKETLLNLRHIVATIPDSNLTRSITEVIATNDHENLIATDYWDRSGAKKFYLLTSNNTAMTRYVSQIVEHIQLQFSRVTAEICEATTNKEPKLHEVRRLVLSKPYSGLQNTGASCYANSFVQQVYRIPGFRNMVLRLDTQGLSPNLVIMQLRKVFTAMQLIENGSNLKVPVPDLGGVIEALGTRLGWTKHEKASQQDAHRFSGNLLEALQSELTENKKTEAVKFFENFRGSLVSRVVLNSGNRVVSEIEDNLTDLSLSISGSVSLEQCLEKFISVTPLIGGCRLTEEDAAEPATMSASIKNAPNILLMHLGRFVTSKDHKKINRFVKIPHEINLQKYNAAGISDEYILYSILIHSGTEANGHVTSQVRVGNEWLSFNDSAVYQSDISIADKNYYNGNETPYILAYIRKSAAEKLFAGNIDEAPKYDVPPQIPSKPPLKKPTETSHKLPEPTKPSAKTENPKLFDQIIKNYEEPVKQYVTAAVKQVIAHFT